IRRSRLVNHDWSTTIGPPRLVHYGGFDGNNGSPGSAPISHEAGTHGGICAVVFARSAAGGVDDPRASREAAFGDGSCNGAGIPEGSEQYVPPAGDSSAPGVAVAGR